MEVADVGTISSELPQRTKPDTHRRRGHAALYHLVATERPHHATIVALGPDAEFYTKRCAQTAARNWPD